MEATDPAPLPGAPAGTLPAFGLRRRNDFGNCHCWIASPCMSPQVAAALKLAYRPAYLVLGLYLACLSGVSTSGLPLQL